MSLINLYYKLPISLQNCVMSLHGNRIKFHRYNGEFNKLVKKIRERNNLSAKDIKDLQDIQLQRLISHAYENVPFYQEMMNENKIKPGMIKTASDLKLLPLIDKEIVKKNFEAFQAKNTKNAKNYCTGGTTGSPLVIRSTYEEIMYNFALYEVREKELFGVKTGDKTATFLGKQIVAPWISEPPFWRKAKSLNQTMYSVYHMNNDTFNYYIDNLRKDPPIYITGYVNPIYQLSKHIIDNGIMPLKVKAIFLSSETLHIQQKEIIEKAFSCEVCDGFSQAEGVSFISSCRNGNLHVHPDFGVTEFIKVEDTDYYEIVGTTLYNYSMPLIRYKTQDYVTLDENQVCSCGSPFLPLVKSIIGRDDSLIKSQSGKVISSAALSLIFKHFPEIIEAQIIQENIRKIKVLIVLDGNMNEEFKTNFIDDLCKVIGDEFDLELTKVDTIPKTISGKHKLVISKL